MNLFFSPNGRIDQPTYWRAVIILFVLSAALSAASAFISPFLGFLGLIFIWPWIAVHVKRFHDSGKSGWLTLAMVGIAIVLSLILAAILPGLFGISVEQLQADMMRDITEGAAAEDPATIMSRAIDWSKRTAQAQLLPNITSTAIVTVVIGVLMGIINKTDPGENRFGAAGSSA